MSAFKGGNDCWERNRRDVKMTGAENDRRVGYRGSQREGV